MRKILFPIDGSEYSKATLRWASCFLSQSKQEVEIYLLIVAESLDIDYSLDQMQAILEEAAQFMRIQGFQVGKVEYRINLPAPDAICFYADEQGIDQIILGSHGQQLAKRFIGSVSQAVLEKASQPVLILKHMPPDGLKASQHEAFYLAQEEALKVLMPVDRPDAVSRILETAGHLLHPSMSVYLLYVNDPTTQGTGVVPSLLDDTGSLLEPNRQALQEKGFANIQLETRTGKVAEEICRFADALEIDQIVMAAHNHTGLGKFFFGSTSKEVLRQSKRPVLVFHEGGKAGLTISHVEQLDLTEETDEEE